MKRRTHMYVYGGMWLLMAFALWTAAVCMVDVRAVGPLGSEVGFARLNSCFHRFTGVNMALYVITDWLGIVPFAVAGGFGVLGLVQWITRRSLLRVERSIIVLGVFYVVVMAAYVLFEILPVNYRPVLIEGRLEASYPSSTTLLTLCVMPSALMQLNRRIKSGTLRKCAAAVIYILAIFMVVGRLVSGVHWLTDIIGGALFSAGLVLIYRGIAG